MMQKNCYVLLWSLWISVVVLVSFPIQGSAGFFMHSRGIPVKQLLVSLGQSYHIPVVVSEKVSGIFVGNVQSHSSSPDQVLNKLSNEFNLAWYYDGNTLYVVSASEVENKVIMPSSISAENLYYDLKKSLNLSSPMNSLVLVKASHAIKVSGVPQFISDAESMASSLDTMVKHKNDKNIIVRVFPLRYASASDITYSYRNQSLRIPGVAKEMQTVLSNSAEAGQKSTSSFIANLPKVTADPRQNSITIMGQASKMPMYASLVRQLDKPEQPVNISVSIIDVSQGDLNSLGVNWSASANVGSGKISFNNSAISANGTVSAVINNSKDFLIKINALESQAKARILSSPSVLTLNNMPAILNRNTTFYTKLEGKNEVKLQQVSTGELLKVTPHLIGNVSGKGQVLLTLSIEDGSPADETQRVDNLPQTQDSQINTQAKLMDGQSLLIGGFIRNEDLTQTSKIPLLGDIPWIGGLFRSKTHTKQNMVRLFLIHAQPVTG